MVGFAQAQRRAMMDGRTARGMRKDLTRYGDEDFSLFLRKAFIKAMGYSACSALRPTRQDHADAEVRSPWPLLLLRQASHSKESES